MVRWLVLSSLALSVAAPARAGSSNSLMDVSADGKRLLVANTDSGTLSVVDLAGRKLLAEVAVGDHPEGAAWVPGQNLALVAVYGDDAVKVVDVAAGQVVRVIAVADEPYGVVTSADGKFAYVTHDAPGSITEIDLADLRVTRTFPVARDKSGLRGLALSGDQKTLYATEFFTGALVAVTRATGQVADRFVGDSQDNLARHVVLHPKRGKAYLSHIRSRLNAFDARGSIFPHLSFVDLVPREGEPVAGKADKRRRSVALDTFNGVYVVTNPWEAALSPDGSKIYTIYAGTNDANVSKTVDDDYEEIDRLGRAVTVGRHPRAVRTSPDGREVYVYNTLDHAVVVFDELMKKKLATIDVATPAHTAEWRRGKELFQSALAPMGTARWIACSSCHPDGLTDGRVWQNPEGNRKTPSMFGMAHTYPLHWSGDRDEAQDFEYTIRGKLMQGRGLSSRELKPRTSFAEFAENEQVTAGHSKDLDALAVYCNSFPARLSPHVEAPGKLSASATRGKETFFSAKTQCATCHSGPYYTDSRLAKPMLRHDVGTGDNPDEKVGPKYDTPSLIGAYRQPSYLHDGRAKTLDDVLTTCNPADKHGVTSHLSKEQVADLVAFLKALPYDAPPDETPNAVKHRIILAPVTVEKRRTGS